MKKLVVYFSATGTTKKLAENLANVANADLFEIQPTSAYTKKDLDWTNEHSRSSIEMSNPNSRPTIQYKLGNLDEYDTIYLGYPIWWYVAPTIVNTFLEEHNWTNKTIIPFATSGGSDIGDVNKYLGNSCKGAKLHKGKLFSPNTSLEDLKLWIKNNN